MGTPSDQFLPLLWRPSYVFFILYGGPLDQFFAYYIGAPDHFLRLLYGAPQISFFSYNMGAPLRSVSLFTMWGPPSDQFICMHIIQYILVFSQNIWGPPQISFSVYYMGPPQVSFFAYYMGSPQISFCAYFFGAPLRSGFSLTIWGPF